MVKLLLAALCLYCLSAPAWPQTPDTPAAVDAAPEAGSEQILVTGQKPGPGLWKVSRGEHVLWVFGTYAPLPRKMEWRSHEVETILSQSQEYIEQPSSTLDVSYWKMALLIPRMFGLKKNPDGAQLRELVPADVYARWLVLKEKYIGKDEGIESERPIFAAEELFSKALKHSGLTNDGEVADAIGNIVKKNKIKRTSPGIKLPVKDPSRMLKNFKAGTLDDIACLSKTLDRLETDIDAMRVRANAWAKGDLAVIEKLGYPDREGACRAAMTEAAFIQNEPGFKESRPRMREAWLEAAEKALAANKSTFAVLKLNELLDPKGLLSVLQARGYVVEKPE